MVAEGSRKKGFFFNGLNCLNDKAITTKYFFCGFPDIAIQHAPERILLRKSITLTDLKDVCMAEGIFCGLFRGQFTVKFYTIFVKLFEKNNSNVIYASCSL